MQGSNLVNIRLATYNLLNTKDRYDEREQLLKQNLYDLHADIVGVQEVVFGEEMLDELKFPVGKRTSIAHHTEGFTTFEAAVQMPIFELMKNPDPRAKLDGNAILLSEKPGRKLTKEMVVESKVLHLSGTRNC
jgi:hypothetical protein